MNRLLQKAPTSLIVGNQEYPINTDFRAALQAQAALRDNTLDDRTRLDWFLYYLFQTAWGIEEDSDEDEKFENFRMMFYDEINTQELLAEAVEVAQWYLRCGEPIKKTQDKPIISYEIDGGMIYDGLLKAGTDLDAIDYLHYWKFCSKIKELPECAYTRVLYLRDKKFNKGKLTKEEQAEINRIGLDFINMVQTTAQDSDDDFVEFLTS